MSAMKEYHGCRRAAAAVVMAVCMMLTACSDTAVSQSSGSSVGTQSSTASSASSVHSSQPVSVPVESEEESAPTEETAAAQPEVTAEASVESAEQTGFPTEDTPTDITTRETTPEIPPETREPQETTTQTKPPETTTVTTTTVATTTSVPEKPPAPVVIPDVMAVSSPRTSAEVSDAAVLDYSNAGSGYISASYSGSSARAKLRIICGEVTYDHDLAVGGITEYFPLSQGSGEYSVQIYQQIEGRSYSPVFKEPVKFSAGISDEVAMYLYPNKYVDFGQGSACVKKGAELCAGADGTIERLAAIFGYITRNIDYDYDLAATVKSGYTPTPDSVLAKGSGICFDYASLFAAMARSQGIPTRLVIGYATDIYHAWNEVYTEETGWISAELLLSRNGYNLVDATFYAGASDKKAMAEYITNSSNYSTVFRY